MALETDCLHLFAVSLKWKLDHSSSGPGSVNWQRLKASHSYPMIASFRSFCTFEGSQVRYASVDALRIFNALALPGHGGVVMAVMGTMEIMSV